MATYIKDSTGNNNAEITGDFTTNASSETLTFNPGTDGKATPLKILDANKAWLIVEVRAVGGTVGVLGKHLYSENTLDIATRVEVIRDAMDVLHASFTITAIHYKANGTCDVYRGDKADGSVSLASGDTNITWTPPSVWVIDDLTPFAPDTPVPDINIVDDSGCDDSNKWKLVGSTAITGSKLEITAGSAIAYPDITEALIEGATYDLYIDCEAYSEGFYRFYVGSTSGTGYLSGAGTDKTQAIVCPPDATRVGIQGVSDCIGTFDNFRCVRRT